MKKNLFSVAMLGLMLAVAPACATKKFVRTETGAVDSKVDTLSKSVEETQERTRKTETRASEVDAKAEAAGRSAADARTAADAAANTAKDIDSRLTTRIDATEASTRRLIYEVSLSEDEGNFKFAKTALPDEAKAAIDKVVSDLKADPKGIYIEIEGHTDNVGNKVYNEQLGLERAEMVKRYLYEQHQVPLHKINIVSYGEEKPVAPNNTREGRAQNRRVVIRVLS
jgi:outer membrane protein OmpA-like peptidoglycan-associated protein